MRHNITAFKCSRQHKLNHTNNFFNYTSTRCDFDFCFAPPNSDDESLSSLTSSCSMAQLPKRKDSEFFKDPFGFLTAEITFEFRFSDACRQCFEERWDLCRSDSKGKIYCDPMRKNRVSTRKLALMLGFAFASSAWFKNQPDILIRMDSKKLNLNMRIEKKIKTQVMSLKSGIGTLNQLIYVE
ncbi:wall-associated receptor kinase 14 [Spatholobus suberectus]|nr:wall-associated receptor kinase 14 [Spatholobus suberectus]